MARNRIATKDVNLDNGTVTFNFADDGKPLVVKFPDLPEAVKLAAVAHGVSQKIGDSYAGADNPTEGRAAAMATLEALKAGEWNRRGAGTGPRASKLAEALHRATGHDMETVQAKLAKASEKKIKALRADPRVKFQLAIIAMERESAKASELEKVAESKPLTF